MIDKNTEENILDSLDPDKWKNKYTVGWCHSCDTATITCPVCENSSCGPGGCEECLKDINDWDKVKRHIQDYLTEEEVKTYKKGLRLQGIIKDSIKRNQNEINWNQDKLEGYFSQNDLNMFKEFFKKQIE